MKTKLLTAAIVCALLLSITGCAADKAEQMLHDNVEITVNTDAVSTLMRIDCRRLSCRTYLRKNRKSFSG